MTKRYLLGSHLDILESDSYLQRSESIWDTVRCLTEYFGEGMNISLKLACQVDSYNKITDVCQDIKNTDK